MQIKISRRCEKCGSEFTINTSDNDDELTKKKDGSIWLTCPICNKELLVYAKSLEEKHREIS